MQNYNPLTSAALNAMSLEELINAYIQQQRLAYLLRPTTLPESLMDTNVAIASILYPLMGRSGGQTPLMGRPGESTPLMGRSGESTQSTSFYPTLHQSASLSNLSNLYSTTATTSTNPYGLGLQQQQQQELLNNISHRQSSNPISTSTRQQPRPSAFNPSTTSSSLPSTSNIDSVMQMEIPRRKRRRDASPNLNRRQRRTPYTHPTSNTITTIIDNRHSTGANSHDSSIRRSTNELRTGDTGRASEGSVTSADDANDPENHMTIAQYYEYISALWILRNAMQNAKRAEDEKAEAERIAATVLQDRPSSVSDTEVFESGYSSSNTDSARTTGSASAVDAILQTSSTEPLEDVEQQQPRMVRAYLIPADGDMESRPIEALVMPEVLMEEMVDRVVRQCLVESL